MSWLITRVVNDCDVSADVTFMAYFAYLCRLTEIIPAMGGARII